MPDPFSNAGYVRPVTSAPDTQGFAKGYIGQAVASHKGMGFVPQATYPDLGPDGAGLRAVAFGTTVFDLRGDMTGSTAMVDPTQSIPKEVLFGYQFHCVIDLALQFRDVDPGVFRWYVMTRGAAVDPAQARYLSARQDVTAQVLAGATNVANGNYGATFGSALIVPVQGPRRYWGLTLICDCNQTPLPDVLFTASMSLH